MEESDQDEMQPEYDFSNAERGKYYSRSSEASLQNSLESLLVWIRESPHNWVALAGELDSVLWHLHMVWARVANRDSDYFSARDKASKNAGLPVAIGLLQDAKRLVKIDLNNTTTQKVLAFWQSIDDDLQIQKRCDAWY
jgi:hypothetical protein